jgi:hypothetical protein
MKPNTNSDQQAEAQKDVAATYNQFKQFEGQLYTGVKVGRGHKWYYDQGEWKEKKITPDLWEFTYAVPKRRAGKAPEGSGVPVGTEYHWYIVAHQNVRKLNANDYATSMTGLKFKVAHKRAGRDKWSASERAQQRRLLKFLHELIRRLESEVAPEVRQPADTGNSRAAQKPSTRRKKPRRVNRKVLSVA